MVTLQGVHVSVAARNRRFVRRGWRCGCLTALSLVEEAPLAAESRPAEGHLLAGQHHRGNLFFQLTPVQLFGQVQPIHAGNGAVHGLEALCYLSIEV